MSAFHRSGRFAITLIVALTWIGANGVGCGGPSKKRFNINVALADDAIQNTTVQIVGVSEARDAEWKAKTEDMGTYFNQPPAAPDIWQQFLDERNRQVTLPINDAIWNTWRKNGVDRLYVLSSRGSSVRRKLLPLDGKTWKGRETDTINVTVTSAGLQMNPNP